MKIGSTQHAQLVLENIYWLLVFKLNLRQWRRIFNASIKPTKPQRFTRLSASENYRSLGFIARRLPEEIDAWQRQLAENDIQLFVLYKKASEPPPIQPEINALFAALNDGHYNNETGSRG